MSATNRGGKRADSDYYPTPEWAVRRFLECIHREPWGPAIFDAPVWHGPAVGDGAIVRAVEGYLEDFPGFGERSWITSDVRPECDAQMLTLVEDCVPLVNQHTIGDFVSMGGANVPVPHVDVSMENPPFQESLEFAERLYHDVRPYSLSLLLRLNWLGSETRHKFVTETRPSVYVLPNRTDFSGGGGDSIEYAWFQWFPRGVVPTGYGKDDEPRGFIDAEPYMGRVHVLDLTPGDVRSAAKPTVRP